LRPTAYVEGLYTYVLDSSALLALLRREPGADVVRQVVRGSVISSVNWSEVFQKALALGLETRRMRQNIEALGLSILPFDPDDAENTALLWPETRRVGLSLGDRACLSLAQRLDLPALTSDSAWAVLDVGVEVQFIR